MGTRNDDISLILAKAKKQGFLPDVKDEEVDILSAEAKAMFGSDITNQSQFSKRPGNRVVFLGDSIVKGGDSTIDITRGVSWPVYASIFSNQRINYVYNAGVAGENTDQMLARFDTTVAAYSPNLVIVGGPTNDFTTGGIGILASQANIKTIVEKIRTIGAVAILCTITPAAGATPTSRRSDVIKMNTWLRAYTKAQGIHLLDFYGVMVDPANGQYLSAYSSGDFIHPNSAGYAVLGKYVSDTLSPLLPQWTPPLPQENGDPNNLVANGLFLTDANADNIPDSWTNQGGVTGQTLSLITNDTTIKGNWFKYDISVSSGDSQLFQTKSSSIIPGNTYALVGKIKSSGFTTGSAYVRMRWTATSGRDDTTVNSLQAALDGTFYCEAIAPAGATAIQVNLQAKAGTGWVQFAQIGLYDLTAMNVV